MRAIAESLSSLSIFNSSLASTWNSWRRFCNTPLRNFPARDRGSRGAFWLLNSQCLLPALALTLITLGHTLKFGFSEDGCGRVIMLLRWWWWWWKTQFSIQQGCVVLCRVTQMKKTFPFSIGFVWWGRIKNDKGWFVMSEVVCCKVTEKREKEVCLVRG